MKSIEFGSYLKSLREEKGIPQRKVAHAVDVDTSTLSKMELGERQITVRMIKPWAEALNADFKELQIKFMSMKIKVDFKNQPYLKEALELVLNNI